MKGKFAKKPVKSVLNDFDYGKIPPQAVELEETVLGAALLEYSAQIFLCKEYSENLFFKHTNSLIAKAIVDLSNANKPVDILTVTHKLRDEGKLDEVGGAVYVASLTNRVASTANIEFHIKILQQEALRRAIIQLGSYSVRSAYDETEDIFDVLQKLQMDLDNSLRQVLKYEVKKVSTIHQEIVREATEILLKGAKSGIVSGFRTLDNVTNGWQKTDFIILAGRPGMGKTAAALSMAVYPSMSLGIPIGVFSLEMSAHQLVSRLQAQVAGIDVSRVVKKQLNQNELTTIINHSAVIEQAPLYIDDTPAITLLELKSKTRRMVREQGVQMVIIDYLQLMRSGMGIMNREQEIAEISRGLKSLAKELNIPVIALSQLSRSVEARGGDKKPLLSDLRESGQIEQDADMVLFCYRPEYYGIDEYEMGGEIISSNGLFMLLVAKHRNGELGEIPLRFVHRLAKIEDFYTQSTESSNTFVQQGNSSGNVNPNTQFLNKKQEQDEAPF